jgi:hypothetical protein
MNCVMARRHLLGSERPARPAATLAAHLANCPACRTLQRRLVRLEQNIPRLPVPVSRPPTGLLEQVLCAPKLVKPPTHLAPPADPREAGRQKLALSFALAAALAVFALCWWAWPHKSHPPDSPIRLAYVQELNRKLQSAREPRQCVERLAELAEEKLANVEQADPAQLDVLIKHIDWLMRHDLPHHAGQVPLGDRAAVLKPVVEGRLRNLESKIGHLAGARELGGDRVTAVRLKSIGGAIQDAKKRLQFLVQERT